MRMKLTLCPGIDMNYIERKNKILLQEQLPVTEFL